MALLHKNKENTITVTEFSKSNEMKFEPTSIFKVKKQICLQVKANPFLTSFTSEGK